MPNESTKPATAVFRNFIGFLGVIDECRLERFARCAGRTDAVEPVAIRRTTRSSRQGFAAVIITSGRWTRHPLEITASSRGRVEGKLLQADGRERGERCKAAVVDTLGIAAAQLAPVTSCGTIPGTVRARPTKLRCGGFSPAARSRFAVIDLATGEQTGTATCAQGYALLTSLGEGSGVVS
ncbi:hypothetical protein [Xylophilus sp.]|uniref:hypothetical protein n=1 Tax=Xylophilus sp. TaxID=2653893 RepID=UPI002D804C1F|nr:hypothetical protein [Xylophilus sp.]